MNQTPIGISGSTATTTGTNNGTAPGTTGTAGTTGTNATTTSSTSATTGTAGAIGTNGTSGTNGTGQSELALNGSLSSTQVFNTLDTTHKGHLTAGDVRKNPYLSANFSKCDTNGDNELSQSEVTLCMQSAPSARQ